ncbi:hypothetical protein OE903_16820 [Bacillus sp. B6(2022)]|nr:hypothetical protein [Bacillus sp. B6(2022)]
MAIETSDTLYDDAWETFMLKTEPYQKHELYLFRFQMYTPQGQNIEEVSTEHARSLLNVWQFIDISSIEHIHSLLSDMTAEWQKPESISFLEAKPFSTAHDAAFHTA